MAFLTWYDTTTGARTELSLTSFVNWVDKTANLLDTLGVDGTVDGALSTRRPGHWMSMVWPFACWQAGLAWSLSGEEADLVVGDETVMAEPWQRVIACSLHPLALALSGLPDQVLDYTTEVLAEPDQHQAVPPDPSRPAWRQPGLTLTEAEISRTPAVSDRVLVLAGSPLPTLLKAVVGPALGHGSAVLVEGNPPAEELARIAAAERTVSGLEG